MNKFTLFTTSFLVGFLISYTTSSQVIPKIFPIGSGPYLGQSPPGMVPERFPPDSLLANSEWFWHGSPVFSPDGLEMYYTKITHPGPAGQWIGILFMKEVDSNWTSPQRPSFADSNYSEMNPFFSTTGDTMYFISTKPGGRIFRSIRSGSGWDSPTALDLPFPTGYGLGNQFSVALNGSIYMEMQDASGDDDIYRFECVNGIYQAPENLGDAINSEYFDYMPFIDPYEQYLIFKRNQPGARGLYISFNEGGVWDNAINMGPVINQNDYGSLWPYVTLDGDYFFFCAGLANDSGYNPYWVSSAIIDSLHSTLTKIPEDLVLSAPIELHQNYPNPFEHSTTIQYTLQQTSHVRLTITDSSGKVVVIIVEEFQKEGKQVITWDGRDGSGKPVSPGVYYAIFSCDTVSNTLKMIKIE